MKCTDCRDHLLARAQGELDEQQAVAVDAHLADCDECRAHEQRVAALWEGLLADPDPRQPIENVRIITPSPAHSPRRRQEAY